MSESNDAPPPSNPPDEPPAGSPFPESSLTPPPLPPDDPPSPPPAPEQPATPSYSVPPPGSPAPAPTPAPEEPAAPSYSVPPAEESPAPPAPEQPSSFGVPSPPSPPSQPWMESTPPASPPATGGLVGGDPLGGPPSSGTSAFPEGYTSPPPPGAGGGGVQSTPSSPGQIAGGTYVLAGWWRRVGAAIIDGIIISILALIVMVPLGIGIFSTAEVSETDTDLVGQIIAFVIGMLVLAVVAMAYAPVMMGKTNGKTLGRMATGIRVVRADGNPITIGFAAIREVAVKLLLIGTVAGSFTFGLASLLDVLWPLWDDENRALHDFVVNTRTVMG